MHTEQDKYAICRHVKTNGIRCQSPALADETFCYFHTGLHSNHPAALTAQKIINSWKEGMEDGFRIGGEDPYVIARIYPKQNEFNFPPLEDAESIQFAASILFHAVAQGQIHRGRARALLQILAVAQSSQRSRRLAPEADPAAVVRDIERTPNGETIAAPDFPDDAVEPASEPQLNDDFAANPNE
jgi:hypothetical protein